jgi:hypothetical protein
LREKKTSKLTLFVLVFSLFVLTVSPASAITYGELDGNDHPQVVLVLIEIGIDGNDDGDFDDPGESVPAFRCTGTLIEPTFVVTAGHCTSGYPDFTFTAIRIFTQSDIDQGIADGTNNYPDAGPNAVEAVRFEAHPDYETAPFFVHDVGMIELAQPVDLPPGTYGELPPVDSLDALIPSARTTFTAVGYGLQAAQLLNPTPQAQTEGARVRMVANPHLIGINIPGFIGDFSLLLSNNAATGGTCFGDSGGPNFLGDTNVIAGVTSFGLNANCAGTGGVFRLDRKNVLDFIEGFMSPTPGT